MLNKLGHILRYLGEKTANAASWLGHKVGSGLTSISPVVSLLNTVIVPGVVSAGMVPEGVGALGDAGKALIARGTLTPWPSGGRSTEYAPMPVLSGRPTTKCAGRAIR
jgi:hypothetical protein